MDPRIHWANRVHCSPGAAACTWAGLRDRWALPPALLSRMGMGRSLLLVSTPEEALGRLAAALAASLDFGLLRREALTPALLERLQDLGIAVIDSASGDFLCRVKAPQGFRPGRITVLTSGSTGLPKPVSHDLATLDTWSRQRGMAPETWFVPWQIGSYAWYQAATLSLLVQGQGLVAADPADPAGSLAEALAAGLISAVSATPTFWRHALLRLDPAAISAARLSRITLGGEIVDQPILDRLAALWPEARLRHVYASSEAGAAIVTADGLAGFDAALLAREGGARLRVRDGRLFIRSPHVTTDAGDTWLDTGDLVELRAGRIHFLGRAGDGMINVGGQKAHPAAIEAHLLTHPGVTWARVTAKRAPFVGQLPVAEIVLSQVVDDPEAVLTAHCAAGLGPHAVPRIWHFHTSVPLGFSLKS